MATRVLIIGGYGNFGSYIAMSLAGDANITLLIGGRSQAKAQAFIALHRFAMPAEACAIDIFGELGPALARIAPDIVIHTTGPFQSQDQRVAKACIAQGCHYLDLADARDFVCNISTLNDRALACNVLVVSGASSVPCLTAAVIDHYRHEFAALERIDYGISAAQQTNRGLATTAAILSYVGKPFTTLKNGSMHKAYGWQDTHSICYPELGRRWFGNCSIPDLDLFPQRYPEVKTIRFAAGHEIALLHAATWALGWLVRIGLIPDLARHASLLLRLAFAFDRLGSSRSGFHMMLSGIDGNGEPHQIRYFMIAGSGHGPYIPCMPAIILTRRLANGTLNQRGASPGLDLITLEDYVAALGDLDISVIVE
jgi:Saccharopine dehydrogenase NADP binding domain